MGPAGSEQQPAFKGYIESVREILRMPATTADPNIPAKRVTAEYCAERFAKPPKNVTMLTRDFIGDSLYNPSYGYFSKQALIFSPKEGYDFPRFRDSADFLNTIGRQYEEIERELDDIRSIPRQLWHTPTEILKPWYGYSVAQHIVRQHKADQGGRPDGGSPLTVYEMGGGNGTLMMNILDYIREHEPGIYSRMEYNLIEISPKLAKQQVSQQARKHVMPHANVNIINKSIFDWKATVDRPCFFVAMEVIDNFAHDVIRFDYVTGEPYQAFVRVYDDGEFEEYYEPVSDPLIQDYLRVRNSLVSPQHRSAALPPALYRRIRSQLPLAPNLSKPEFIPTKAYEFCKVLGRYFPRHRLVLSDFYKLPDTLPGAVTSPVVQTRFNGSMVPCETYLVQPGWFDIFFPTDFELLRRIYDVECRPQGVEPMSRVCTQRAFAMENAALAQTRTRSGENPMLDFYENNKFLLS
ncbi:hypothetical protein IWW39_003040 [Coemansia spiralis]|uniref:Protein arginine methyltransferase NDUFAF7 n=1 Tax=Coemansia spiralis TaxID=417178 RepID=A0A9W8L4N8_9FUNG|nr:hypothetical protein IWW39_003040 [Coemansia spiralis]